MKLDFTVFHCDECNEEITIKANSGFPYQLDWCYLYHLDFKLKPDKLEAVQKFNQTDKHFCSALCLKKFLLKVIMIIEELD